jgi:hypothetical protein
MAELYGVGVGLGMMVLPRGWLVLNLMLLKNHFSGVRSHC